MQYCGGCSVLWMISSTVWDIIITGYHQYIGGCSVLWGNVISTVGGYQQYCKGDSINLVCITTAVLMVPPTVLNTVQSTDDIPPPYSTEHPPQY